MVEFSTEMRELICQLVNAVLGRGWRWGDSHDAGCRDWGLG